MQNDILRNGDVVSAAVLAALGAYVIVESSHWTYSGEDGPGPAFFPLWYGVALVGLSLMLIIGTLRRAVTPSDVDWSGVGRALVTWAAFAASAMLMRWLGFVVSFALLAFFMIAVVFRRPPLRAGFIAVGAAAGFYILFPLVLGVALPSGLFGF
ncbi:MAG: tripartite tricarboxylate transporter TctB family protein [Hyphomicrobiales bacterium]|nr:tripartite tricarboxylate transporter TctB family protein [Hyphomicrobiales bacterium]